MTLFKRWAGPAVIAVVVMALFQWFAVPLMQDARDDWEFLHTARMNEIRRVQQQMQQPQPGRD